MPLRISIDQSNAVRLTCLRARPTQLQPSRPMIGPSVDNDALRAVGQQLYSDRAEEGRVGVDEVCLLFVVTRIFPKERGCPLRILWSDIKVK